MDILSFVKNVKTFKKSQLIDKLSALQVITRDLEANLERLTVNKISLDHQINQWAVTQSVVKHLDNSGYRGVGYLRMVTGNLTTLSALYPSLIKLVQQNKDEIWDGKILNLRQANLLNLIEHIEHWLKYTTLSFDVLMSLHNKATTSPELAASKADARWLNGTLEFYKGTCLELLKGSRLILQALEAVPEIEVSETSVAVLESTEGKDKLDMLKKGFGVHQLNPLFWFGLANMKYNLAVIEKARRDNELFAAQISRAVNQKNGVNDAALDEQIEVYRDEIIKNVALMERIENSYA